MGIAPEFEQPPHPQCSQRRDRSALAFPEADLGPNASDRRHIVETNG
jgi:hypothetical protein